MASLLRAREQKKMEGDTSSLIERKAENSNDDMACSQDKVAVDEVPGSQESVITKVEVAEVGRGRIQEQPIETSQDEVMDQVVQVERRRSERLKGTVKLTMMQKNDAMAKKTFSGR